MAEQPVRLIWSLASAGMGTTISGSGNSGPYATPGPLAPNAQTALDLRWTDDLALFVYVGAIVTAPSLKVQIDGYDDLGNLIPAVSGTPAAITTAGAAAPVYIGRHGGAAGLFVVLPSWGRVSWTCTGGSVTGTEISLFARG